MHYSTLCLVFTSLLMSCSPQRFPTAANPEPGAEVYPRRTLAAVNALRKEGCRCGNRRMPPAPPLNWDNRLQKAAQRHADDMHRHNFFDHRGSDDSTMSERAAEAGFEWSYIAENIAYGYPSAEAVVQTWKESPGHCENMLDPNYTRMGVAERGGYWVQVLGTGQ